MDLQTISIKMNLDKYHKGYYKANRVRLIQEADENSKLGTFDLLKVAFALFTFWLFFTTLILMFNY